MKSFVYIGLAVLLGSVAVQGYGPKVHRKKLGGSPKSHSPHDKPPHEHHHEPPQRPHHPGFSHHRPPHHHNFEPPNHHDSGWDNSPIWDDRSDSRDSSDGSGSYDSYYGPDDSYDSVSGYRDHSDSYGSSYEDYHDWHDHRHTKRPCPKPHTKRPPKTTTKPTTHRVTTSPKPITPSTSYRHTTTVGPTHPITTASIPYWHSTTPTQSTNNWETTTSSPEIGTTTEAGGAPTTTMSPQIEQCINKCPVTPEYNPVCGSDDQTYDNEGRLFCAFTCGVNVTLRRRSVCPPPRDDTDDGSESPEPTTTTTPFMGRTTPLSTFQQCMRLCRITGSFTPVCGTDLVTYLNKDRLICAQGCGEVVEVLCEKPCAACGFNPVPKPTTSRPTTTPQIGRSTQEPDIQECINACPVTPEYNPVCGSDHVTYSNPSKLLCAQLCGVGVAVTRLGPCGTTTTTSTTTEAPRPTLSPSVLSCIRSCPVTPEYNPVCGTDDLTYNNLGNLHCSRNCGVDVDFKHLSRCVEEFDLGPDGTDSTTSETSQDINGSKDYVTTPSEGSGTTSTLFPVPTTISTAIPPTTPSSTETTTAGPNSSSTLGFTIPIDVLIDIFGSTTTEATKTRNPDEDEDLDIDARFDKDTDAGKGTVRSS